MREPETSNKAQERQDRKPRPVEADPRLTPRGSGAIHGGEETKPGQMAGDEDISPNAPQAEIEKTVERGQGIRRQIKP